jgi:SHS2 domain-containing protein
LTYRWVEHTAEVELALDAATPEEVFRDALTALAELVDEAGDGEPVRRRIELEAPSLADLLAAWLEELVFLAETEALVPGRAEEVEVAAGRLAAVVAGRTGAPRPVVKAVTYHGLRFEYEEGRWRAHVVLDV